MEVCVFIGVFIGYHLYLAMVGICYITVNVLARPLNGYVYIGVVDIVHSTMHV